GGVAARRRRGAGRGADAGRRRGGLHGRGQPVLGGAGRRGDRPGAGRSRDRGRAGRRHPRPGLDRTGGGALMPLELASAGWGLALTAPSAASTARSGGFHFDPATTLPWAVPLILVAPVIGYVLVLGSVRTRRGAATVTQLTILLMLAATLLVGWARFRQSS